MTESSSERAVFANPQISHVLDTTKLATVELHLSRETIAVVSEATMRGEGQPEDVLRAAFAHGVATLLRSNGADAV